MPAPDPAFTAQPTRLDPTPAQARPISIARPPRIEFGAGTVGLAGIWAAERGVARTLVIADAFNGTRAGLLGLRGDVTVFADVRPEPDIPDLERALEAARDGSPDAVVGFGGGSAMDLAKLVAVMLDDIRDVREIAGPDRAARREVALIQVPTTAGTGSEAGTRALLTDPATLGKIAVESRHLLADLAVVDPELTVSVPPAVTAATGIDALAHCVEAFTSRRAHPLIDIYAREGIGLIGRYLARAVRDGADVEARAGLALASLYGGFCLGPVNTTAGHAVSYPLGTRHAIPHGLANALIFPHVLAFNEDAQPDRTAEIRSLLGLAAGDTLSGARAWCEALGIDMRLSSHGVPEADLETMARDAHAIRRLLDFNPREVSVADILGIYRAAY